MEVFDAPSPMRAWSQARRQDERTVAAVPTMGALHAGHLALIEAARALADVVIVTIFVNPLQFDRGTDFEKYPRPIDDDLAACAAAGVDAVYAPTAAAMYPPGFDTHVEPGRLADRFEGGSRPGHFRGVTTVVAKLLAATAPHVAVFGRKDFQQLAIVRRMVTDLDLGIEIVGVDTVREPDGLAMSSRNARLTADDRAAAAVIPAALGAMHSRFEAGVTRSAPLLDAVRATLAGEPRARLDYVEIVDADTLQPIDEVVSTAVAVIAVWFGDVRLIDNRPLTRR